MRPCHLAEVRQVSGRGRDEPHAICQRVHDEGRQLALVPGDQTLGGFRVVPRKHEGLWIRCFGIPPLLAKLAGASSGPQWGGEELKLTWMSS